MTAAADVAGALIGTWPQHVTAWGPEAIQAYVDELGARGLDPDRILDAIRSWPTPEDPAKDFPPSAAALAQHALRDPDAPAFTEVWDALMGPGGVLRARTSERKAVWGPREREKADELAMADRLVSIPELVQAFVAEVTLPGLRARGLGDPEYGAARRRQLEDEWNRFVDRGQRRVTARLVAGARRERLRRADPVAAIQGEGGEG